MVAGNALIFFKLKRNKTGNENLEGQGPSRTYNELVASIPLLLLVLGLAWRYRSPLLRLVFNH
jgi:hypothetical protein